MKLTPFKLYESVKCYEDIHSDNNVTLCFRVICKKQKQVDGKKHSICWELTVWRGKIDYCTLTGASLLFLSLTQICFSVCCPLLPLNIFLCASFHSSSQPSCPGFGLFSPRCIRLCFSISTLLFPAYVSQTSHVPAVVVVHPNLIQYVNLVLLVAHLQVTNENTK